MTWQWTPYTIPLFVTTAISLAAAVLVFWHRRHIARSRVGALLLLAAAIWMLGSALELSSVELSAKVTWDKVQFVGICIIPTAWLTYTLRYTGRERYLTLRNRVLLSVVPLVTFLLVMTNEAHGLIWSDVWLEASGRFLVKRSVTGAGLWVYTLYSYALILLGLGVLLVTLVRSGRLQRWQAGALSVVVITAWLINVSEHALNRARFDDVELTPFALAVTAPILAWAFYRLRRREMVPVARDAVVEDMPDALLVLDAADRVIDLNPRAQELLGVDRSETLGRGIQELWQQWPDWIEHLDGAAGASQEVVFHQDGNRRAFELHTSALLDWQGEPVGQVVVFREITERLRAEEKLRISLREKEVLLQEIHHRVKNNLQVISSLLNLQANTLQDRQALEALRNSQDRIRSMALVHEKLYESSDLARIDFADYACALTRILFHSYKAQAQHIALHTRMDDVLLSVDSAIPCGLILNELVSNALKHAFPHGRPGNIAVGLFALNDKMVLAVADDGIGLPQTVDLEQPQSLGLQLVKTLASQLDGWVTLERDGGTTLRVTFPTER